MSRNFELLQKAEQDARSTPRGNRAVRTLWGPLVQDLDDDPVVGCSNPLTALDDLGRQQIANLARSLLLTSAAPPRAIVFCGIEEDNGCTRAVANLGELLSGETNRRVCLVDADLQSPQLHVAFGLDGRNGVADVIRRGEAARRFVVRVADRLWILPAGQDSTGSLVAGDAVSACLMEVLSIFDCVLVRCAPADVNSSAFVLGRLADGVVLAIESSRTRRDTSRNLKLALESGNVRVLGAILNNRTFPIPQRIYAKI